MQIHVHIVCCNEADVIAWTLAHYAQFADRIFCHDPGSTDGTREIVAAHPLAQVVDDPYGREHGLDDGHHLRIKETAWRGRGADWVVCVDADELLHCPAMPVRDALRRYEQAGRAVPRPRGWEMVGPLPEPFERGGLLHHHARRGFRWDNYSKCCLFDARRIGAMNWSPGCHAAAPADPAGAPLPVEWAEPEMYLLHMRSVGTDERLLARKRRRAERLSAANRAHGAGFHVLLPDADTLAELERFRRDAADVPGVGLTEPHYTVQWGGPHAEWDRLVRPALAHDRARALEVGCWEGRASRWLLAECLVGARSELTVVDTFAGGADMIDHGISADGARARFDHNTAPWRDRLSVRVGRSDGQLCAMRGSGGCESSFDFVYIDASHEAADVLTDSVLAWPLIKPGGMVCWDDYGWHLYPEPYRCPGPAIDAMMACFAGRCEVLHHGYQVFVRKTR